MKKEKHRIMRRLASLMLAMAVTAVLLPSPAEYLYAEASDGAYLEESGSTLPEPADSGAVAEGAETGSGEDMLSALPGDETAGLQEDIGVDTIPEENNAEGLQEFPAVIDDPADTGTLEQDGIVAIEEDEDAADGDGDVLTAAGEDMIAADEEADELQAAGTKTAAPVDPGLSGGNTEHIDIPVLFEKMGVSSDVPSAGTGDELFAADSINYKTKGNIPSSYHNLTITQSGTTVKVTGTVAQPWSLAYLYVDGTEVASLSGQSVNSTINMNNYATGYHTVALGVLNYTDKIADIIGKKYIVSNTITAKPGYNGVFEVYSNYLNYFPYDMAGNNAAGNLYMEYIPSGGKTWARSGYMKRNSIKLYIQQSYSIKGLRPNTVYHTRIRYGTYATYSTGWGGDGKSYFFGGPVRNTTMIKTGVASKPAIKSVQVKAVNIKYHKVRHPGYYNYVGGTLFWHSAYTEKFYTCNVKITVKLKKKPGTKGLWINGKFVQGNKKTYTAKFTPYPNYYAKRPRGRYKYLVSICTGQDAKWGGYSPLYQKNKKYS